MFPRMTRQRVIGLSCAGLVGSALLVGVGAAASAHGASARVGTEQASGQLSPLHTAPAVLAPPTGQSQIAVFRASGVQVYQCTAAKWSFVEPAASLRGWSAHPTRVQTAIHFRGPSWESTTDGSLVEAASIASSPVAGSIPELLLKASKNRGDGIFGRVTYIQRLATSGGAAPAGACTDGATAGVPYRAEYHFFSPSH